MIFRWFFLDRCNRLRLLHPPLTNFVNYPLCFLTAFCSDVTSQLFSWERGGASDIKNPDPYYSLWVCFWDHCYFSMKETGDINSWNLGLPEAIPAKFLGLRQPSWMGLTWNTKKYFVLNSISNSLWVFTGEGAVQWPWIEKMCLCLWG